MPRRDRTMEPPIVPPEGISPKEVRTRWPNAIEDLEFSLHEMRGTLSVDENGDLWFEFDFPTNPLRWSGDMWKEEP